MNLIRGASAVIRLAAAPLALAAACAGEDRVPSPTRRLFAHYTLCSERNPCIPEVVITRRDGAEVRRFQVWDDEGPCVSILDIQWAGENVVGVVCHGNHSMGYYFEVDIASGKVLRQFVGYNFVRSPDYAQVAHVGWIVHSAPPWVQSAYLQVGNTILYPLPPGMKPVVQKPLEMAPEVVQTRGLVFAGVHNFQGKLVWSPDSRKIGFVDCLVDYRLRDDSQEAFDERGEEENRRCFAVAVGLDGKFRGTPVVPKPEQKLVLRWTDARTLQVSYAGRSLKLQVP
jgi:hypothetical protein